MRVSHVFRVVALGAALAGGGVLTAGAQTTAAPATTTAKSATPGLTAPATPATTKQAAAKININTATASELDALPHIGEKRSAAIIKGRPYKSTEELLSKKVLSKGVYEGIKSRITI